VELFSAQEGEWRVGVGKMEAKGTSMRGLALLKGQRRCTVHLVYGEREERAAAVDWRRWAVERLI
jgi:hypothetical protein